MPPNGEVAPSPPTTLFGFAEGVFFRPRTWLPRLPHGSTTRAVLLGLGIHFVVDPIAVYGMTFIEPVPPTKMVGAMAASPVGTLIAIFLPAALIHTFSRFSRHGPARFSTIVQILAYAHLAMLAAVIPVLGPVVAAIWYLWRIALGLRLALGRSWVFALTATAFAPLALLVAGSAVKETFESFKIPSASMAPNLVAGDHIFANKTAYGWFSSQLPERGDVVVFRSPENTRQDFVKRVIGMPGDIIVLEGGVVRINGWKVPTCKAGKGRLFSGESDHEGEVAVEFLGARSFVAFHDETFGTLIDDRQGPYTVAAGEVFVLGDNRENSHDSRAWFEGRGGGVPVDLIKGRAAAIWMSTSSTGTDWSRTGTTLHDSPRCPPSFPPETCAGIERCLREAPPRSATLPPAH